MSMQGGAWMAQWGKRLFGATGPVRSMHNNDNDSIQLSVMSRVNLWGYAW